MTTDPQLSCVLLHPDESTSCRLCDTSYPACISPVVSRNEPGDRDPMIQIRSDDRRCESTLCSITGQLHGAHCFNTIVTLTQHLFVHFTSVDSVLLFGISSMDEGWELPCPLVLLFGCSWLLEPPASDQDPATRVFFFSSWPSTPPNSGPPH